MNLDEDMIDKIMIIDHTYIEVLFPSMRINVMDSLAFLSDKEIQKKEWCHLSKNYLFWSTLSIHAEFLYDDLCLYREPEDAIGYVTLNQEENDAMKIFYDTLDKFYDATGQDPQPDEFYFTSPLWDEVVEAAKKALEVFLKNEEAKKTNPNPYRVADVLQTD